MTNFCKILLNSLILLHQDENINLVLSGMCYFLIRQRWYWCCAGLYGGLGHHRARQGWVSEQRSWWNGRPRGPRRQRRPLEGAAGKHEDDGYCNVGHHHTHTEHQKHIYHTLSFICNKGSYLIVQVTGTAFSPFLCYEIVHYSISYCPTLSPYTMQSIFISS